MGCAFNVDLNPATRLRADTITATHLAGEHHWQTCTVPGSKGERSYAWAWVATASPRHFLPIVKDFWSAQQPILSDMHRVSEVVDADS